MVSLANTEWTGLITPPRPPGPYGGGPFGIKVRFLADGSVRWMVQLQPNKRWQTDDSVQWMVHIKPNMKWGEWNKSWRWEQRDDVVQFGDADDDPSPQEIWIGTLGGQTISGTNRIGTGDVNQFSLELTRLIDAGG